MLWNWITGESEIIYNNELVAVTALSKWKVYLDLVFLLSIRTMHFVHFVIDDLLLLLFPKCRNKIRVDRWWKHNNEKKILKRILYIARQQ